MIKIMQLRSECVLLNMIFAVAKLRHDKKNIYEERYARPGISEGYDLQFIFFYKCISFEYVV